jgi:hypothetical protein
MAGRKISRRREQEKRATQTEAIRKNRTPAQQRPTGKRRGER